MSELMSKIGNLTNRLREGFMELSPRDRALLSGMGVLFVGLALGGGIWWMDSREADLASKVEAHKQSVAVIKAHIDNFQKDSAKAATCEAKLVAHKGKSKRFSEHFDRQAKDGRQGQNQRTARFSGH